MEGRGGTKPGGPSGMPRGQAGQLGGWRQGPGGGKTQKGCGNETPPQGHLARPARIRALTESPVPLRGTLVDPSQVDISPLKSLVGSFSDLSGHACNLRPGTRGKANPPGHEWGPGHRNTWGQQTDAPTFKSFQSVSHSAMSALCDPMDCSPPGSSVHGILQARRLQWASVPFSRGSSPSRG